MGLGSKKQLLGPLVKGGGGGGEGGKERGFTPWTIQGLFCSHINHNKIFLLKNTPTDFHIDSNTLIRPVKQNKFSYNKYICKTEN